MYLLHADHKMVTVANIIHLEMPYLLYLPITPWNSLPIRVCYLCYVFRAFEPHACCIDIVFNRSAIFFIFLPPSFLMNDNGVFAFFGKS